MSFQFKRKRFPRAQEERVRYITPRNNGEISNSITQNWTDQAVMCYRGGCNCTECSIGQSNYSFVCQMPQVIKILIEQIGPPDQERIEKLLA